MEKIVTFIISLWIKLLKVHIEQNKAQAKTLHVEILKTLSEEFTSYYIDRSGINQKVGAALI